MACPNTFCWIFPHSGGCQITAVNAWESKWWTGHEDQWSERGKTGNAVVLFHFGISTYRPYQNALWSSLLPCWPQPGDRTHRKVGKPFQEEKLNIPLAELHSCSLVQPNLQQKKIKYLEFFIAWNMLEFSDYFYMEMFSYWKRNNRLSKLKMQTNCQGW